MLAARQVREAAAGGQAAEDREGDEAADEDDAEQKGAEVIEQPEDHVLINDRTARTALP